MPVSMVAIACRHLDRGGETFKPGFYSTRYPLRRRLGEDYRTLKDNFSIKGACKAGWLLYNLPYKVFSLNVFFCCMIILLQSLFNFGEACNGIAIVY